MEAGGAKRYGCLVDQSGTYFEPVAPSWGQFSRVLPLVGRKKLYIDGSLSVTKTYSVRGTSTSPVNLGKADALLDELRIYERVLSDQEVSSLYNLGLQGESGLNDIFLFTLDSNGTHKTATTFDYKTNASSYTITVEAKDELNATTEGNFTVTVATTHRNIHSIGRGRTFPYYTITDSNGQTVDFNSSRKLISGNTL